MSLSGSCKNSLGHPDKTHYHTFGMKQRKKNSSSPSKPVRHHKAYHDGFRDGLTALEPLDLAHIRSIDDMVRAMSKTAFGGRNLGEAADVLEAMVRDEECFVVMTLSGAMTVAKMGLMICEMIDRGMVQAIVSTGALMAHGLVEAAGMKHFKYEEGMDDRALYHAGYDRVYDTLELEQNLDDAETLVRSVLNQLLPESAVSSRHLHEKLGEYLSRYVTWLVLIDSSGSVHPCSLLMRLPCDIVWRIILLRVQGSFPCALTVCVGVNLNRGTPIDGLELNLVFVRNSLPSMTITQDCRMIHPWCTGGFVNLLRVRQTCVCVRPLRIYTPTHTQPRL